MVLRVHASFDLVQREGKSRGLCAFVSDRWGKRSGCLLAPEAFVKSVLEAMQSFLCGLSASLPQQLEGILLA
jgi:hypothetical protein